MILEFIVFFLIFCLFLLTIVVGVGKAKGWHDTRPWIYWILNRLLAGSMIGIVMVTLLYAIVK